MSDTEHDGFVDAGNQIINHLYKAKPSKVGAGSAKTKDAIDQLRHMLPEGSHEAYLLDHLQAVLCEFLLGKEYKLEPYVEQKVKESQQAVIERVHEQIARKDREEMAGMMQAKEQALRDQIQEAYGFSKAEHERIKAMKELTKICAEQQQAKDKARMIAEYKVHYGHNDRLHHDY